jgi:hypothetical protein
MNDEESGSLGVSNQPAILSLPTTMSQSSRPSNTCSASPIAHEYVDTESLHMPGNSPAFGKGNLILADTPALQIKKVVQHLLPNLTDGPTVPQAGCTLSLTTPPYSLALSPGVSRQCNEISGHEHPRCTEVCHCAPRNSPADVSMWNLSSYRSCASDSMFSSSSGSFQSGTEMPDTTESRNVCQALSDEKLSAVLLCLLFYLYTILIDADLFRICITELNVLVLSF